MIEYFGRHGCKQCIQGKPIRFGYKVWCLNTSEGYLASFDLYQGKTYEGNKENEELFGKCGATVLKNLDSLPANKQKLPIKLYFDNLFTSLQLLQHLKCSGYGATGTLPENRGKKCPLTSVNNMKKLPRGSAEYVTDTANQIVVCRWMDNSVVTIASTCHTNQNSSKVFRYSQKEKKRIQIDCPEVIKKYNKHMGGLTDKIKILRNIAYRFGVKNGTGAFLRGFWIYQFKMLGSFAKNVEEACLNLISKNT